MKKISEKSDIKSLKKYLAAEKPGVIDQRKIARILKEKLSPPGLFSYLGTLKKSKNWIHRDFACCLIPYCFDVREDEIKEALVSLASDADWRVRENVTWTLYELLKENLKKVYPWLKEWAVGENRKVRRALIIAAMRMAKHRDEKLAVPLLNLVEHSLADEDKYVQKAVAFAIGDGFIRYYPTYVFARLEKWIKANNTNTKIYQLIAISLSTAEAVQQLQNSFKILRELYQKEDKSVQNAVVKSLIKLSNKKPQEVYSEIQKWCNGYKVIQMVKETKGGVKNEDRSLRNSLRGMRSIC